MKTLLVIGASGRAAAEEARQAGFAPTVIDLFGDIDTHAAATVILCPREAWPEGLPALARRAPPGPWMYTGGLENYPDIVGEISRDRELRGNTPATLRAVRDPFSLPSLFPGFAFPQSIPSDKLPPGRWLRKPYRGGGGLGIRDATAADVGNADVYFQEYIDGVPMSALSVGSERRGVFHQLIGCDWLHAAPFAYCGNIGPVPLALPDAVPKCLVGAWGLDFMLVGDVPHLLEVNPRYPASAELLARSGRGSVFGNGGAPKPAPGVVGKAIYYAPFDFRYPADLPPSASLADVPQPGSPVGGGSPVLTLFAHAVAPEACVSALEARAARLDLHFAKHRTDPTP